MHDDELEISADAVGRLVSEQYPEHAGLPIERVGAHSTVHAVFRIGGQVSARFPLRSGDPSVARAALDQEAVSARELAAAVTVEIPEPLAIGAPGEGYPLPWSLHRWVPGATAAEDDPSASVDFALDVAGLVAQIVAIPTRGRTFRGSGRGGDLHDHDWWMRVCFDRSEHLLPVDRLRATWSHLRPLPRRDPDQMTHGDLVPGNLIVRDGRLTGVLDVGGLGAADPAVDLVVAWHALDDAPRAAFREQLAVDDLRWQRGIAWAFQQAMGLVWYYETSNPTMSAIGRRTLDRILAARPA
jgi:aminoglycoside phosphotransferase (APT) family kinase protein